MELWLRRLFWLAVLVTAEVGTLCFVFIYKRPAREGIYIWLSTMIVFAAIALRGMLRALRETPADLRGLLQWRLSDLLTASLLTGAVMTLLSASRTERLVTFDLTVSMTCGFGFALGLLIAARMDLSGWRKRHLYAAGFSLRILGLMALALILSVFLLANLGGDPLAHRLMRFMEHGLGLGYDFRVPVIVDGYLAMPFALFAAGHWLCYIAAANKPAPPVQQQPSAPAPSSTPNASNLKPET